MTPNAAKFMNGNVWQEWKNQFPKYSHWTDNYPKDYVQVDIGHLIETG